MVAPWRTLAVALALTLLPAVVHADGKAPWAQGVTDDQKATAKELLDAGNALMLQNKYLDALDKYSAALEVWDHPAIRFNVVRCLIQLGRDLEAFDNLQLALKYGAAPLEEAIYNEALGYQKLLQKQIGDIKVTCSQVGVKLTIDGQPLAVCPAQESRRLLAGPHQIVGNKTGLLPKTLDLVVIGGEDQGVDVTLEPLAAGATIVHRWPNYIPWTVFAGGFAIGAIGGVTLLFSHNQMRQYDQIVDDKCTGRCTAEQLAPYAHYKDNAVLESKLGVTALVLGTATVATGAVMVYLNRGRTVYPEVAPLSGGGAALSFSGAF
ncbi:MAG TPA: tetratricopeptide repeat protein [Kofleriaceae bacterium]|jgi:tetratricopeptide (TPR) repeat protein